MDILVTTGSGREIFAVFTTSQYDSLLEKIDELSLITFLTIEGKYVHVRTEHIESIERAISTFE